MALSNSVFGSVATPRVYVDYIQYAKAIGYVKGYELDSDQEGDPAACWDFNPVNMSSYRPSAGSQPISNKRFVVMFKNHPYIRNKQFALFMSGVNYYGLLGHSLTVDGVDKTRVTMAGYDSDGDWHGSSTDFSAAHQSEIVGDPNSVNDLGFTLYKINTRLSVSGTETDILSSCQLRLYNNDQWQPDGLPIQIGSWTIGRYFDFPHNANLQMNIKNSFEGIRSKRTIGGSEITEITYTKPNWGNLPPWQHIDVTNYDDPADYIVNEDYRSVANKSRRSWDLTFSYLSKSDTFPKSHDGSLAGNYFVESGAFDVETNLLSSFHALTLGGQIPFIFQPDKTKKDFCMCKLKSNGISVQQSAPQLYTCQLAFEEVW